MADDTNNNDNNVTPSGDAMPEDLKRLLARAEADDESTDA